MKNLWNEFKKFISRGSVVDMSIGVIVGSAFTAIVTALTNKIFMPFVNFLLSLGGEGGMESAVTMLKEIRVDGVVDMDKSIYIDWGAFIIAILNFFIIAFILFLLLKALNAVRNPNYFGYTKKEYSKLRKQKKSREEIEEMARQRDLAAKEAEEAKKAEEEANRQPSPTEVLLAEILAELKKQQE